MNLSPNVLEFIRIFAYPVGAVGVLFLVSRFPKLHLTLLSTAFYFLMWTGLLFVQLLEPDSYRVVANAVSTPGLILIVASIWSNVFMLRKE